MSTVKNKLAEEIGLYYSNPSIIQQSALDLLEAATGGEIDVVDASNPFMFLLEASATNTYAAMLKCESVSRELYPLLATSFSDLYNHMADVDYLDRFASPTQTTFTLVIQVNTLRKNAIHDPVSGVYKAVIPRDTQFTVGGYDWYVHRPINILIAPNGAIQVHYDLSAHTPLVDVTNNLLDYSVKNTRGSEELVIDIPVEQLKLETVSIPISPSKGLNTIISFSDKYYHARAYHTNVDGVWTEMAITHAGQVYDSTVPTLIASVGNNVVRFMLPEIYTALGGIGDTVRIDIYTTKGLMSVDLTDYTPSDFSGKWQDLTNPKNIYLTPMKTMTDMLIFASGKVSGGKNPLTFDELRNRVIYRSADNRASITFEELSFELNDRGYRVTKSKDTLTQRKYICSKTLPSPTSGNTTSVIGVRHGKVTVDTDREDLEGVVINHGIRKTITSLAVFKESDGIISLLSRAEVDALAALNTTSREAFANELNDNEYYYSPFVYVMDPANNLYSVRTYYLDNPLSTSRSFIASNTDVPFAVNTKNISVSRLNNDFIIIATAEGPKGISDMVGQLVYTDTSGKKYRIDATQQTVADNIFNLVFVVQTTLDISADGKINVANLMEGGGSQQNILVDLDATFDIYYIKNKGADLVNSLFDSEIYMAELDDAVGVTHETIDIMFGTELTNLHVRSKGYVQAPVYETYPEDVVATYESDVYDRDEDGRLIWEMDSENKPVFAIRHYAGDPILGNGGSPTVKHLKGDVVLDVHGNWRTLSHEKLVWEIEPVLLDAKYRYATASGAVVYRTEVAESILTDLKQDIDVLSQNMMARTTLALQPTASIGKVTAIMNGKTTVLANTSLDFSVNYMLIPGAYEDAALRKELTLSTKAIVNQVLNNDTFSIGELVKQLKSSGGEDVVDVSVGSPLGQYNVATLIPGNSKFSIKSVLVPLSNGTYDVVDSLEVTFTKKP